MRVIQNLIKAGVVGALLATSTSAFATHPWSIYHIASTSSPISLKVVDSVTGDWQFEFDTALNEWNGSLNTWHDFDVFAMVVDSRNDSNKIRKRCKMKSGQMRVCNANYGGGGWAGMATININSNGHITQGTAKMNDFYSYSADFKRHVMCQEIGHVLGLGHTSEDGSSQGTCMDYSNSGSSISPNEHDYDQLADIYDHLESYDSYDVGGGETGGCNAPQGKGCNKFGVGASAGGPPMGLPVQVGLHHEVWVAADGWGGFWVHHVFLVPNQD
jgi:hypothetical protein